MSAALHAEVDDGPALPALLRRTAGLFLRLLRGASGARALPAPVLPPLIAPQTGLIWRNWLFAAEGIARAHVELFEQPGRFAVLHTCIFPLPDSPAPIFGFDIIAGHAQATGMFLDLTPVVGGAAAPLLSTVLPQGAAALAGVRRTRPDWGDFFSPDFVAVRPDGAAQTIAAAALGAQALAAYLRAAPLFAPWRHPGARAGQIRYVLGQRRNPHTRRMLARQVGEAAAGTVIDAILFPMPS